MGQLVLAIVIAEVVSFMPAFERVVGMCVGFFRFKPDTPAARICGTMVGATLPFCLVGLFEIAFQAGFGVMAVRTYLKHSRSCDKYVA